jgi:FkbM family methyltransferase
MLSTWKRGWQSGQTNALFDWVRRFVEPGQVVWDVGANQGLFTFAAAARVGAAGCVVALEPDPFLASLLHRSRSTQHLPARIDILPVAVSGRSGLDEFSVAATDRALNHLAGVAGNPRTGGERDRFAVVTVTLDWLATHLPPPSLVKIDVEGAEFAVLEGGRHLLEIVRPRWIIEVARENVEPVSRLLRAARYRLSEASAPDREIDRAAWNTLAVPIDQCDPCGDQRERRSQAAVRA